MGTLTEKEQEKVQYGLLLLKTQDRLPKKFVKSELARKVGTNKSYISKIEHGLIKPGVGQFLRIIDALGLKFDIVKPVI